MADTELLERARICLRRAVMFARLDGDERRAATLERGIVALTAWDAVVFEAILEQSGLAHGKVRRLRLQVEVPELRSLRLACARALRWAGEADAADRVAAWGTCSDLVEAHQRLRARAGSDAAAEVMAALEATEALAEVLGYGHRLGVAERAAG